MLCVADVFIRADVLETFSKLSLTQGKFELEASHYASGPPNAWDPMLQKIGSWVNIITDPAMYLMVASGMRGGVCTIIQRYANANNS